MSQKENRIIKKLSQTKRLVLNGIFFIVSLMNIALFKSELGRMLIVWVVLAFVFGLFITLGLYGKNQEKNS